MNCIKLSMTFWLCSCSFLLLSQNVLQKSEAVSLAIENNFDIKIADNQSELALNNTSKFNTGQLPSVSLNGGYNYNLDNTSVKFQDGRTSDLAFAASQGANVSVNADYLLFDGFMRKYNIQQLQERYALTTLELKATMENIAAQTLSQYYLISTLSENLAIIDSTINVSQKRLERAREQFDYGQANQLAVLNAQVDLNNDSLNYINAQILVENAKRTLNNIMVTQESIDYVVVSEVDFITPWSKDELKTSMYNENLDIIQINKSIEIGNMSINIANARKLPQIGTNLSYGYSYNKNNSASFLSSQNTNGLTAGVSLSWNIFDGGTTRHAIQEARLNTEGLVLQKAKLLTDLDFAFETAWANYRNALFVYQTQLSNVEISQTNFRRSEEQFKIGQINSVDFRQAQLNLLNAETVLNTSKFDVKIAEVELLLLSGRILN